MRWEGEGPGGRRNLPYDAVKSFGPVAKVGKGEWQECCGLSRGKSHFGS